jgi:HAD superfamily hydrolase (TIGR01459 family)
VLEQAAARDLPMLCANPDLVIVRGGQQIICAGLLAEHYRQMGGRVRLVGKPDPAVYAPVIETLGMPPSRICAVGDSLATDIRGATNASVASVWILGGIHSHLLDDPEEVVREAGRAGLAPVAALPAFVW